MLPTAHKPQMSYDGSEIIEQNLEAHGVQISARSRRWESCVPRPCVDEAGRERPKWPAGGTDQEGHSIIEQQMALGQHLSSQEKACHCEEKNLVKETCMVCSMTYEHQGQEKLDE